MKTTWIDTWAAKVRAHYEKDNPRYRGITPIEWTWEEVYQAFEARRKAEEEGLEPCEHKSVLDLSYKEHRGGPKNIPYTYCPLCGEKL